MNEKNSSDSREKSEYWEGSNHIYYRGWCRLWFFGFFLTIILNKFWQSHISGWWMTDINGILAYYFGESNGTPLQYSCLENSMDGGAWWAAVHGVEKSRTRLSDFTFTFLFHALEKEIATHSSVLAWRIPGTGESGGLLSMGSQSRTRLKRLSVA